MPGWIEPGVVNGLALAAVLALWGCQPDTHEAQLADYLERVARVTEGSARLPEPRPGPSYPSRRALRLEIPHRTIDVAEFFELHGCDMGALVGFRNSPLGRLQTASQRLGYEAAWLAAAKRCGPEAAEWVDELAAQKRAALPALFWNATFAADELHTALGSGRGGTSAPAQGDLANLMRGLHDSYRRMLEGGFDVHQLERVLGRLNQGSWAGPARRDWSLWRRHLNTVSALLGQAIPGICLNRRPTPRARRLHTVFRKYYVDRIQPELARRMRRQDAWITELSRLSEDLAAVRPAAYRAWFDAVLSPADPDSEWQRTRRAVVTHAEAWQRVLGHCGIEPAGPVGQD